ncbi:MAG TPA: class I SAM-dependent methyltransferase [Thermomicrobiales bacterium]|jgi:hypothetical protein|nr:class I SAM-dependent methyltransferase [Thermomicrobiales bacterium]
MLIADRLASPEGLAVLAAIGPDPIPPGDLLRVGERLRHDHDRELVAAALTLHDLRIAARTKFTRADAMWLTRPGLEQATAEPIARRHAGRFQDARRVADLCTGIGGDLVALAGVTDVLAVDLDPEHLRMATLNAGVYAVGDRVTPWLGDVRAADLSGCDGAFIDPARRTSSGRMGTGSSEPPLDWAVALTGQVPRVGIKAAPGIDHDVVPDGWELELVADGRDLKEAALWSPALATAPRRATILPTGATLVPVPGDPVPVGEPRGWLLDPNPAVTRAGLVEDLARTIGASKIDDQVAFLTADRPVETPFARTLRVLDSLPWHEKVIAARLRELGIGGVDIRRRGLAGDVEQIRKRFKLSGAGRATLAMTRHHDQPWCVICEG